MSPEQRRSMIIQSTIPLVITHGRAVTTRQIAQSAGIGEGTIFRVFADKDELLDACVAEALSPGTSLSALAAIALEQPLPDRLAEAAETLRAHLDRIGAIVGALHTSGRPPARRTPAEGSAPPDRAAGMAATRSALAELFAPERNALRLSPDQCAQLFLGLLFTGAQGTPGSPGSPGSPGGLSTAELVDVFLHGALPLTGTSPAPGTEDTGKA